MDEFLGMDTESITIWINLVKLCVQYNISDAQYFSQIRPILDYCRQENIRDIVNYITAHKLKYPHLIKIDILHL